ncbi:uncharacterized protein PRCAT00003490001 [Priceomyces carsonii]|uniref:uncharacterized protein n=1 Tax=Priceomyces carsonii TaxID=28549 RepID=UPI002ED94969|nr:unnamed protein product [Priceomyces carsonii]
MIEKSEKIGIAVDTQNSGEIEVESSQPSIHRSLEIRHIQLIAIGGLIGTALFISIGSGLIKGGPLGLFLAYTIWTIVILFLCSSVGEMVSYLPISSPFITMAGRCVDESLEFCAGWNYYIMLSLYIPFEITAVNGQIHFWRDDYSPAIPLCVQIVLYVAINIFAVRYYGESEFWLSLGKLILAVGLIFFTFITMIGGNPQHDVYGFRNWNAKGGPIAEYLGTGSTGRFQGFLAALIQAAFTIVGPEYISMVAGEAKDPRKSIPTAFRTVMYRLVIFFILGSLSVSIIIAYNNPTFLEMNGTASNAAASPYVVAMKNMGIKVLPDIVNILIITSSFSAGNSQVFCTSRVLHSLSRRGFAPRVCGICTRKGVPIVGVGIAMCFALLSLLQLGSTSATVLNYIVSLCTGSQVLNYVFMSFTYFGFYRACKAQGIDRKDFSYTSWCQPYSSIIICVLLILMVAAVGYSVFLPGQWEVDNFLFSYIMVFINIFGFVSWKLIKRTKLVKPEEADLKSGLEEIESHEYDLYYDEGEKIDFPKKWHQKILSWLF